MAQTLNKLKVRQIEKLTEPGWYGDGGGLYLRIAKDGRRSWVFVSVRKGKRSELGFGAEAEVGLERARELASETRAHLTRTGELPGKDHRTTPVALPSQAPAAAGITFGDFASDYIASVEAGWRNEVHRQQWRNSLRDHAASLRDMPVAAVGTDEVLAVLRPIWLTKPETASRVRGRIEKVLSAAKAKGLRPRDGFNPATWRGHLDVLLPKQSKLTRGHHAAIPYADAPAFMTRLRARSALSARCLEFCILTAARSGEVLGATWGEIDLERAIWTVPAIRMKAGVTHVVPLSAPALAVLEAVRPEHPEPSAIIFAVGGTARSNMAIAMLLRRMDEKGITVHGFRSSFRDWAGDTTSHAREVIEAALAHTIQNKAERAYRRSTALERRRVLMNDWAIYLSDANDAEAS